MSLTIDATVKDLDAVPEELHMLYARQGDRWAFDIDAWLRVHTLEEVPESLREHYIPVGPCFYLDLDPACLKKHHRRNHDDNYAGLNLIIEAVAQWYCEKYGIPVPKRVLVENGGIMSKPARGVRSVSRRCRRSGMGYT